MADPKRLARYERIYDQLEDLIKDKSPNLISAMATIVAVLHHKMPHHFWTGFYFTGPESTLHVGPYQGTLACQVLKDSGVCLHGAKTRQAVVVPDVEAFDGHIACDSRSKSEIVMPVMKNDKVIAVLDIDSQELAQFDTSDIAPLEKILSLLDPFL
ncbi:MAG: GAF domain-containing protein [Desulfobacterales bacterium]|nr:GAF domain-containing protein [Desulfobacterales bacterium]